jgi:hypothetical protein
MSERRSPRYEIIAQVELTVGDEVRVFVATNVSAGGMFCEADAGESPDIVPGQRFPLTVSLGNEGEDGEIPPALSMRCLGRVVHRSPGSKGRKPGFGVSFEEVDRANLDSLRQIIAFAAGKRA